MDSVKSGPENSSAKQKYEQELQKYDKQTILMTWLDPLYAEDHEGQIKTMEDYIANGFNVEKAREYLESLRSMPPGPILDPTEPRGLTNAVYRRIEYLKYILAERLEPRRELNIKAVLQAYRSGNLQVEPGKASYWQGGKIKRAFGKTLSEQELVGCMNQWNREEEPGTLWIEEDVVYPEMAETGMYGPYNEHGQHMYNVNICLIDGTQVKTVPVLDDTGASFFSLHHSNANYPHSLPSVTTSTASGTEHRERLWIQIQWLGTSGTPIGDFVRTQAVIHRGNHMEHHRRLSGTFVRRILFTGTAPDGNNNLVVSNRKTGVVTNIPAV